MKTIWKFPLTAQTYQSIEMPIGASILTAQLQGETLCIWALVDKDLTSAQIEKRHFLIFGTGHDIMHGYDLKYISTFQLHGGALVFHLFEELKH